MKPLLVFGSLLIGAGVALLVVVAPFPIEVDDEYTPTTLQTVHSDCSIRLLHALAPGQCSFVDRLWYLGIGLLVVCGITFAASMIAALRD